MRKNDNSLFVILLIIAGLFILSGMKFASIGMPDTVPYPQDVVITSDGNVMAIGMIGQPQHTIEIVGYSPRPFIYIIVDGQQVGTIDNKVLQETSGTYSQSFWVRESVTLSESPPTPSPNPVCGNGVQEAGETCQTCLQDSVGCGTPNPCGNGIVDAGESCNTCPKDMPAESCKPIPKPPQDLTGLWFYVIMAVILGVGIFVWRR